MKARAIVISMGLAAALLATGCAANESRLAYIGADEAKAAAVSAAGLNASDVDFSKASMDKKDQTDYYHVEFSADGREYVYDVDALTGAVIASYDASAETAVPEAAPSATPEAAPDTEPEEATVPDDAIELVEPAEPAAPAEMSEERAKQIALEHAGVAESDAVFVRCRLDYDDGRKVYEVEFHTPGYSEYDYDIDAATGEIVSYDLDAENFTPPANAGASGITPDDAKRIALEQVPGATMDDIYAFETDYDDGRLQYEGKIIYGEMEYEFEIDGYSSAIRDWDAESIYD